MPRKPDRHRRTPRLPISVIIPTYNRGRALRHTIECLVQQQPPPLEIIVVDQSEQVPEDVAAFLSHEERRGNLRLIRQHPPNAQAARNRGIREAQGDVLLFLDDDIECGSGFLSAHWGNYQDPRIAAVSGMILEPGYSPTEELPERCRGRKLGWMYLPLNYAVRVKCINLSSCNCSIRREIALAIGGFDENFVRTLFDDSDFSWRVHQYCRSRGLEAVHDPGAWLTHLHVPSGGKRPGNPHRFLVADAVTWENLLYFHLRHWGLEALRETLRRYRWWIWHKKNMKRPWWLFRAHIEMLIGFGRSVYLVKKGPRLISRANR